jgi:hypothetical protein
MRRCGGFFALVGFAVAISAITIAWPSGGTAQEASPEATEAITYDANGFGERTLVRTESLQRRTDRHLTLFRFALENGGSRPSEQYLGTQILVIDDGAVRVRITDVGTDTTGSVIQTLPGAPCEVECSLEDAARISEAEGGLVLTVDSTLSHDGEVRYELEAVDDPAQSSFVSGALQGGGARGTRACASGCR